MKKIRGIACSEGIGIGPSLTLTSAFLRYPRVYLREEDVNFEIERIRKALCVAQEQIDTLLEEGSAPGDGADFDELKPFLQVHSFILRDQKMFAGVERLIRYKKINAEWALIQTFNEVERNFSKIKNAYLNMRSADVRHVFTYLLNSLQNKSGLESVSLESPVILICEDLTAAESIYLFNGKILGIVTEFGGIASHTSIICQSLHIPLIAGVRSITEVVPDHCEVIIDGTAGSLIIEPTEEDRQYYRKKQNQAEQYRHNLYRYIDYPAQMKDGRRLSLAANIDTEQEASHFQSHGGTEVGLLRSEFLFLQNRVAPSEQAQYEKFKNIFTILPQANITIRTWDLGVDRLKMLDFLPDFHQQDNPALGLRAIRLYHYEGEFFRVQLRAILRAAEQRNVRILIPMVTTMGEMERIKAAVHEEMASLEAQPAQVEVGAMIETPAAALVTDELADFCDFLSVGSNDLVQYVLAVDRNNEYVNELYSGYHPAVLRLLRDIITVANRKCVPISICGELATDPIMQLFLLGIGRVTLSMIPDQILRTKKFLSQIDEVTCKKTADRFLSNRHRSENIQYKEKLRQEYASYF